MNNRRVYILLITFSMIFLTLGYFWGKNDAYNRPVTVPIFNKYYLPNEPIEYKDGSPILEYSTTICYTDRNNIRKSDRPYLPLCNEIIQDNYDYLEREILNKLL